MCETPALPLGRSLTLSSTRNWRKKPPASSSTLCSRCTKGCSESGSGACTAAEYESSLRNMVVTCRVWPLWSGGRGEVR